MESLIIIDMAVDNFFDTMGKRIRILRDDRKMNQTEMANRMGQFGQKVDPSYLSQIERGGERQDTAASRRRCHPPARQPRRHAGGSGDWRPRDADHGGHRRRQCLAASPGAGDGARQPGNRGGLQLLVMLYRIAYQHRVI